MYDHGQRSYRRRTANTVCDSSAFKVKANQVKLRWDGFYVIKEDGEPRDPQDFPPPIRKQKVYKDARSPQVDIATTPTIVPL